MLLLLVAGINLSKVSRMSKVWFDGLNLHAESGPDVNTVLRRAGWHYDSILKDWQTPHHFVASKVPGIDSQKLKLKNDELFKSSDSLEPLNCSYKGLCPPGLKLRNYQLSAIEAIDIRNGNALIADPMGAGKTIVVCGYINHVKPESVLVVCPASVKFNWKNEIEKWVITGPKSITEVSSKGYDEKARFVVINYDIAGKHEGFLKSRKWDLIVLDEAHYLKNPKAQRSRCILGGRKISKKVIHEAVKPVEAKRKLALTGTPLENRPVEIFGVIRYLNPAVFPNKQRFEKRYCDLKLTHGRWDNSGASNMDEMQKLLRQTVMIRRSKSEILKELPAKVRRIITIEPGSSREKGVVRKLHKSMDGFKKQIVEMRYNPSFGNSDISALRREAAMLKAPYIASHIQDLLEGGKVVFFCWHKCLVDEIHDRFKGLSVKLTGSTPSGQRGEIVKRFQEDKRVKLLIGNIQAAGIGITLTSASQVVFGEMDWVIGKNLQAEDRCHRIGQRNSVLVDYVVFDGGIDSYVANAVCEKADILEAALDNPWLI